MGPVVADRVCGEEAGEGGSPAPASAGRGCKGRSGKLAWDGEDSQTCRRELRAVDTVTSTLFSRNDKNHDSDQQFRVMLSNTSVMSL